MANRTRAKRSRASRKRVNRTKAYRSRANRSRANRSRVNRTKANRPRANRRKKNTKAKRGKYGGGRNTKAKRKKYGGRPRAWRLRLEGLPPEELKEKVKSFLSASKEEAASAAEAAAREEGDRIVYLREKYVGEERGFAWHLVELLEELRARKILSTGTMKDDDWRKNCLAWHVNVAAEEGAELNFEEVAQGAVVEPDFHGRVEPEISGNTAELKGGWMAGNDKTWYRVVWNAASQGGKYVYSVFKRFQEFEDLEKSLKNIATANELPWSLPKFPAEPSPRRKKYPIPELNIWLDAVDTYLDNRRKELAANPGNLDETKITAIKNLNRVFAVFLILDDQGKDLWKASEYPTTFSYNLVSALQQQVFGLELKVKGLLASAEGAWFTRWPTPPAPRTGIKFQSDTNDTLFEEVYIFHEMHEGWPVLKNADDYYCYRVNNNWFLSNDFTPEDTKCRAYTSIENGQLPVGKKQWKMAAPHGSGDGSWQEIEVTGKLVPDPEKEEQEHEPDEGHEETVDEDDAEGFEDEQEDEQDEQEREREREQALVEAARQAFPRGTKVTWVDEASDIPRGTVGTVTDPAPKGPSGYVTVTFPEAHAKFLAAHLRPHGAE